MTTGSGSSALCGTGPEGEAGLDMGEHVRGVRFCFFFPTGGEVMICVADQYGCELNYWVTLNLIYNETIVVKVMHKNKRLNASTYRGHLFHNFDLFHSFVESNFPVKEYSTSHHIIFGNFNISLLNIHELQNDDLTYLT